MKSLILLISFMVAMVAANSQSGFNAAVTADSAGAAYVKATVGGGPGNLTISAYITKVANTGSTVAGYAILQGSIDDTSYVNVKTYKITNSETTPITNAFGVDTFTLANTTALQTYSWQVPTAGVSDIHPYYYYRIKVVMTTTTATCRGKYLFRKRL